MSETTTIEYYQLDYFSSPSQDENSGTPYLTVWRSTTQPDVIIVHEHPGWRSAASGDDRRLLEALLQDWKSEWQTADALFVELDNLSAGLVRVKHHAFIPKRDFHATLARHSK